MVVLPPKSRARNREIVDSVFYGHRPVQVDQSYLDQLIHARCRMLRRLQTTTLTRLPMHFIEKPLKWKADAQAKEAQVAALQAELAERAAALDQAQATIARERALHQTTHEEKWGLNLFRLMATWLIEAHSAGRSDRPEFAELRDMAKDVTDAIQRGNPFRGYRDEPEKKARLEMLVAALDRP